MSSSSSGSAWVQMQGPQIIIINKCENWNFENHLRIGVLKIKLWIGVLEIKFERNWSFEN